MLMNETVTCLAFSRDADMLASASTDGQIKVRTLCVCFSVFPSISLCVSVCVSVLARTC
jgi:hypothetical protein